MRNLNGSFPKEWQAVPTNISKKGDLKEAILTQSPVPENMDTVKKLDDFLKDLSAKSRKYF